MLTIINPKVREMADTYRKSRFEKNEREMYRTSDEEYLKQLELLFPCAVLVIGALLFVLIYSSI